MHYQIDTHIFLWFVNGNRRLLKGHRHLLESEDVQICLSIASIWEMSIKHSMGKLDINEDFNSIKKDLEECCFTLLPITFEHSIIVNQLPFVHKDPFDRMIASQAIGENMKLISQDEVFKEYAIQTHLQLQG